MRGIPLPRSLPEPLWLGRNDAALKAHASYRAAKSGDAAAAARLVIDLTMPMLRRAAAVFRPGLIAIAPHAIEATGENAIPTVLATAVAAATGGETDPDVVQNEQVFHTGADPMERLNARATFDGPLRAGEHYVLVDDVTTMGGTLADLADHVQRHDGIVAGIVVIVNAARSGRLLPDPSVTARLERRFGDVIRELFDIDPAALTAEEAQYLIGFRSADEIRNRSVKARQTTLDRLRTRRVQRP